VSEKRSEWVYATDDGELAVKVDFPFGLIPPPTVDLHRPLVGTVRFYSTATHLSIKVKKNALTRSASLTEE
jgi:hypothetical protein